MQVFAGVADDDIVLAKSRLLCLKIRRQVGRQSICVNSIVPIYLRVRLQNNQQSGSRKRCQLRNGGLQIFFRAAERERVNEERMGMEGHFWGARQ